jgi:hypothetical protein
VQHSQPNVILGRSLGTTVVLSRCRCGATASHTLTGMWTLGQVAGTGENLTAPAQRVTPHEPPPLPAELPGHDKTGPAPPGKS